MATRTERVVLELEDNFTTGMARAAAATALLKREVGGLNGSANSSRSSVQGLSKDTDSLSRSAVQGSNQIDRYSGRLTVLAQVAGILGPALVPVGAIGIPAAAGLADALAGVGLGAATALLAFHGLGEGISAINKASLDPTVSNLRAAQLALEQLPPSAREFARELASMRPALDAAREAAARGLFPGLEASLDRLKAVFPQIDRLLFHTGSALGNLAEQGAASLAGPEWAHFLTFIQREAPLALTEFGHATGDVIHGLAELWMAFTPLNHDFLTFIGDAAAGFDDWASGLSKTQGFGEFIAYLSENGPKVADAVVAIGNAVLQIVEAAAPLGGPILQSLTAVANAVASIADSKVGPTILATVTALSLLARAQASFGRISEASWIQAARGAEGYKAKVAAMRPALLKGGAAAAGLALATSGVADTFGLANTTTLALTGSLAGPWGAAAGGAVGLLLDMSKGADSFDISSRDLTETLNDQTGAITKNTRAYVAQQLQQKGILDAARNMGLSLDDVTSAALGNAAAYRRVQEDSAAFEQSILGNASAEAQLSVDSRKVKGAIEGTRGALTDAKGAVVNMTDALGETQQNFKAAKTAAENFRREIVRVNDVLTKRKSLRDYEQALIDFADRQKKRAEINAQIAQAEKDLDKAKTSSARQAARERIKSLRAEAEAAKNSLDLTTQQGIDTQAALDQIASSAIAYAQTLKGADQINFLAKSKKAFIEAAVEAGKTRESAKRLADNLFKLSKIVAKPKIYVDGISESLARLEVLAAAIRNIHSKSIAITARTTGGRVLANADGGTIPGSRAPYGDKVLSMLAPGEEVISNRFGQADANRDLLKAINSRRYADGGTVAAGRVNAPAAAVGSGIDYSRMADALSTLRPAQPLYGDVHVTDGYGGFKRELERDRQLQALSGARR